MAKNEVTKVTPNNTAVAVPDFMKEYAGQGMEDISNKDIEIPCVKLLQAISPELQELEGIKQGEFLHTIAEQSLGKELKIVPIYLWNMFILWRPRHDGGGILARADDGIHWNPPNGEWQIKPEKNNNRTVTWRTAPTVAGSKLDQWGTYDPENQNSQPAATKMYNIVAYLPDFPELSPCVITLQRSAIKVARRLMGKLKITRAPSFGQQFIMSSAQEQNSNGESFWNYKFVGNGFVTEAEDFEHYKALYEQFKATGVKIKDIDGLGDDDTPAGDVGEDSKDY